MAHWSKSLNWLQGGLLSTYRPERVHLNIRLHQASNKQMARARIVWVVLAALAAGVWLVLGINLLGDPLCRDCFQWPASTVSSTQASQNDPAHSQYSFDPSARRWTR